MTYNLRYKTSSKLHHHLVMVPWIQCSLYQNHNLSQIPPLLVVASPKIFSQTLESQIIHKFVVSTCSSTLENWSPGWRLEERWRRRRKRLVSSQREEIIWLPELQSQCHPRQKVMMDNGILVTKMKPHDQN